jgi:hypothetical protein
MRAFVDGEFAQHHGDGSFEHEGQGQGTDAEHADGDENFCSAESH